MGNSAAVFTLQRYGHEVWPLPTVLLPHHPGHGQTARTVFGAAALEAMFAKLEERGWLARVDAVISGYLAEPEQADFIARAVSAVKKANPQAVYLCDPVLGDTGTGLYVSAAIARKMPELLRLADIVTPNIFELAYLSGSSMEQDVRALIAQARSLGNNLVVVTSAPAEPSKAAILGVTHENAWRAETLFHKPVGNQVMPKGTGDLFAACLLHAVLTNMPYPEVLGHAANVTERMVRATLDLGSDELVLERCQHLLFPGRRADVEVL